MNPLNRKMFRQPGMSRQPMGILASSPELANVVRRRTGQPVQMAHGGYHPPGDPMGRLSTSRRTVPGSVRIPLIDLLPKSGFARPALDRFMAAAGDDIPSTGIGAIRGKVQQDALTDLAMQSIRRGGSPFGGDDGSRQMSDAERMAANRASLAALRGSVGQDALTDQAMSAIAAGGSPRDGIEAIDPRITDNIAALTALRGKTRADALSDEAMAQMRPDPSATTNPNILPAMPDESSGLGVLGEDPTGLPFGIEKPFIAGEAAKPKNEQPTDAELAAGQAKGMSQRGDFPRRPSGDLPKADVETDKPAAETDKPAAEDAETALVTDPADLIPKLSQAQDNPKNKTAKQKADATDSVLNIKNLKERKALLKNLLGEEKAKDIRTDAGYNLMMTGLLIAAGQSEDAMTNIAKGLAGGLQGFGTAVGEEAQAERKFDRELSMLAYSELSDEQKTARAAEIRARELAEERDFRRELSADKIQAQKEIAAMPGETQRLLNSLAASSGRSAVDIYLSKSSKSGPGVPDRERFITDGLKTQVTRDGALDALAKQGINNPDDAQIAAYLGTLYDGIVSGASASQAQTTPSDGFGANVTVN